MNYSKSLLIPNAQSCCWYHRYELRITPWCEGKCHLACFRKTKINPAQRPCSPRGHCLVALSEGWFAAIRRNSCTGEAGPWTAGPGGHHLMGYFLLALRESPHPALAHMSWGHISQGTQEIQKNNNDSPPLTALPERGERKMFIHCSQ